MKRWVGTLALAVSLAAVASLSAEEPHLDFVRALRARQYNDLALEYLQKISPNASPELAKELPLEFARTRLELAKHEHENSRRVALYAQARKDLEAVLKANPEREGEARLEIAQVAVLQGKAQLHQAQHAENPKTRQAEMLKARAALEDAGKQLDAAARRISAQLDKLADVRTPKEMAERRALEQAKLRADFDRGLNFFDQALTFTEDGNIKTLQQRGELVAQAERLLKVVADTDPKNPLCWQAHAWVGRCYHEGGDPNKARTRYQNIMGETNPAAEAGKRLAAYFRILVLPEAVQAKENPTQMQQQAAEDWLKRYAPYLNTPEGQGVLWRLDEIYYQQANEAKDPKVKPGLYAQAKELYRRLEQMDGEYSDRARDRKIRITFIAQGGPVGDVSKFTTFEDCYVRAQYEAFKLEEDPKEIKDAKELEKKERERLRTIVTALGRGLQLAETGKGGKVSERDRQSAAVMLAFAQLRTGDYPGTVKTAETLVYGRPQSNQAPNAAVYALEAYLRLVTDPVTADDYRDGMAKLVQFIKQRWPEEPVGDYARHQYGLQLMRERKFPEAVAELATIKPTYPNIIQVKWQLAAAAEQAEKDKAQPVGSDQRPFKEQALAALRSMPELPADANELTCRVYVSAQLQIGNQLFQQKKSKEMENLAKPLLERLPQMALPDEATREQLRTELNALVLYARYGQAEDDYSAGKYAEVRKGLEPIVEEARAGKLPELKAVPELRYHLLGLALRANVMENNLKRAQEVLQVLQSYADGDKGAVKTEAILQPIVLMMSRQVEELRGKGRKEELDRTVQSFSEFLDLLRKEQKQPSPEFQYVLGQSYLGLGRYAEAAAVLESIPAPADGDERAARLYHAARLLHVKALREANKLDEADKALKAVLAEPWGKQSLEARKEEGHLLDARGRYGPAVTHWNGLVQPLAGRVNSDANAKEQYFEVYFYLTRSYYRFAMAQTDAAKRNDHLKRAGGFIAKLEASWPDLGGEASKARFMELMDKEPALKKAYQEAKGGK